MLILIYTGLIILEMMFGVHASISEEQLLALPQKVHQQDGVRLCQQQGMKLVRIQDEQSNQIVYNFAVKRALGQYWIDANDRQTEGQWVYEDGSSITYNKWHPGEPNNWNNEDCVHGSYYGNGFWNDVRCDINNAVICYREKANSVVDSIRENQLLALPQKVNHQDAVNLCRQQGMNLIKVQDEQTNQIVFDFAVTRGLGQYWMDANDRVHEGQWVYEDGNRITYSKWHPGEPNNWNNEGCLHGLFYGHGFWNDVRCDINNAVICYRDKSKVVTVKIQENQLIPLPNKVNYQDAVNLCKAKGLSLIKIQNEETNQLVYDFANKKGLGQYWIDANDRNQEGIWRYENGDHITFSKWHPGEPNNWNKEDCLHGLYYKNGFWNDINCGHTNAVICYDDGSSTKIETETETKPEIKTETKTITETVSIYLTLEKSNYDDAIQYCKNQNLRLIRVDSAELNKLVVDMIKNKDLGTYWIDGNDRKEKGTWLDSDGNKLKYKNFKDDVKNDSDDAHCINGFSFQDEQWNIALCDSKHLVICF